MERDIWRHFCKCHTQEMQLDTAASGLWNKSLHQPSVPAVHMTDRTQKHFFYTDTHCHSPHTAPYSSWSASHTVLLSRSLCEYYAMCCKKCNTFYGPEFAFFGGVWDFGSAAIIMYNQLVVFSLSWVEVCDTKRTLLGSIFSLIV